MLFKKKLILLVFHQMAHLTERQRTRFDNKTRNIDQSNQLKINIQSKLKNIYKIGYL